MFNKLTTTIGKTLPIVAISTILFTSGCATILDRGAGVSDGVYITANTPDAKVFNEKNQLIGTTPLYYKLNKNAQQEKLTIEKEKFETQNILIQRSEKKGYAFLDAMFLCIPCIVDYSNGKIYRLNKDTFSLNLNRVYDKDVERINLLYQDVEWGVNDGDRIGINLNEPLYFKKSSFNTYLIRANLCDNQKYNRYNILNCSKNEDNNNSLMLNANTIQIVPVVNTLKANFIKEKGEYVSKIETNITWKFTKRSGTVIKEVTASYNKTSDKIDVKPLLAQTLYEAFSNIINEDENFNLLLAESKSDASPESLFKELTITQTKTPKFAKNKDLIGYLMKGVVTIKHHDEDGHGSGFFINKDGYLITNHHVVGDKKMVAVKLNESITLNADVIRTDERYDIALLKVNGQDFRALEFINSDSAQTGEDVFAIGTPSDISLGQSVTKGIISGKRKIADKIFLQTDVTINGGNSGGPLLNEDGKVIGMVTMKLVGKGIEGIGFCVPSNVIIEMLNINIK